MTTNTLTSELTFQQFQETLAELLQMDIELIREDAVIYQEIGIDSLGLVNLGVKVQKKFGIQIPPSVMVEVKTIGDFYNIVKKLVK